MRIAIFGKNSLLASGFQELLCDHDIKIFRYNDFDFIADKLSEFDWIINFGFDSRCLNELLKPEENLDIKIAKRIISSQTRLVFLSSRKVYKKKYPSFTFKEDDELLGLDPYSKNKILQEKYLRDYLKDQLLILRIPNVIATPSVSLKSSSPTFSPWLCKQIITNKEIALDRPFEKKDFITLLFFQQTLKKLVMNNATGIYNISRGKFIEPIKLIRLYTNNKVKVKIKNTMNSCNDDFVLCNDKLFKDYGIEMTDFDFHNYLSICAKEIELLIKNPFPGV